MDNGIYATAGRENLALSIGLPDLAIVIVVPVVAAVLDEILSRLGYATFAEIKKRVSKEMVSKIEFKVGDIEAIIQITHPSQEKVSIDELTKAINKAIAEYLLT